jgi:hypothetical protein
MVFNARGKLVYFGPYSDSPLCGAAGGLVERALDQTLLGQRPAGRPLTSVGCFCGSHTT